MMGISDDDDDDISLSEKNGDQADDYENNVDVDNKYLKTKEYKKQKKLVKAISKIFKNRKTTALMKIK